MIRKLFAELIGTFALVFIGCGAICTSHLYPGTITHMGVAAAFGLIVMIMIYAIGNVSGAHMNPAVTIGFTLAGRTKLTTALGYIIAQLAGGTLAAFALKLLYPSVITFTTTQPSASVAVTMITEIIFSFLLMFIILNVSTGQYEKGIMAGVAVGGFITVAALVAGPICGASLNPARSIGPALAAGKLDYLYLYIISPVIGTALASPLCKLIQGDNCCPATET